MRRHQADLAACPTEEILLVADPGKVYGEQWYFTYTAAALEAQMNLRRAGEEEEKARLAADAEVSIYCANPRCEDSAVCRRSCVTDECLAK